ncbi:hypothetical protein [Mangrovicoccus sp. HB161399]|uniref:hypothetical protein n=1 Tax=Mangrovicoccus sp. HB161399 TaxID=2720392 RepID=UPI0015523356|nr:hypothetical protein [Mangrovicoccus sp. HB161399]
MDRIRTAIAGLLVALAMAAGLGLGLLALAGAAVIGGAAVLAARLAGPQIFRAAERHAEELRAERARDVTVTAA